LIPNLTARENVMVSTRSASTRWTWTPCWAGGLEERMNHFPAAIGGEQQRVASPALAKNRAAVATSRRALDMATASNVLRLLVDSRTSEKTVLIITHTPRSRRLPTASCACDRADSRCHVNAHPAAGGDQLVNGDSQ